MVLVIVFIIVFMRWSRGGASGRSDGGCLKWVDGWVCERGIDGIEFEKGV